MSDMDDVLKGSYPKYQYSVFTKNGRDEQFVIRADDFEEFLAEKRNIDTILAKQKEAEGIKEFADMNQETRADDKIPGPKMINCGLHNKPMYKKTGKFGEFYSHIEEVNGIKMSCNGRTGYKEF